MLSTKENFYETLKPDGHPDRLVNGFEFMKLIVPDPALRFTHVKIPQGAKGIDGWGVTWSFADGESAPAPYHTPDTLAIKDILHWRDELKIPDLADANLDWSEAKEKVNSVDRDAHLVSAFFVSGVFERLHMLMGFEDALVNMMLESETTKELCDAICEQRLTHARLLVENLRPDIVLSHDDWGTKTNLFMKPDIWRTLIKPQYRKIYDYFRSEGVIVMHHADSFMEPIVDDMVELGIDIWQGVLPQNDIVRLQKELRGRMILMGGIDAAVVDTSFATETVIREETRRACETYGPGGHFIPCLTYGEPGVDIYPHVEEYIRDEIRKYNETCVKP
ncbi:MAG: uroporphyrinogen decarboxylase (URO-D) [Clostridiales Family XIII bacterium]|jgi:hypothetical protein|nr:uroporphyrinogen decarboxylase (URO-D) [Clostridiales Family XIII bacterium]